MKKQRPIFNYPQGSGGSGGSGGIVLISANEPQSIFSAVAFAITTVN